MPPRKQQLVRAILSGPSGRFVRKDVLPAVEEGDTESALAARFTAVCQFLSEHSLLRGVFSSHGTRGGGYFQLDRAALHEACTAIQVDPSITERLGLQEAECLREVITRKHAGKVYANVLLLLLDNEYAAGGKIELASGVLAGCKPLRAAYPDIMVDRETPFAGPGETAKPRTFMNIPSEVRQSIIRHLQEAASDRVEPSEVLTPAAEAVLAGAWNYIHGGRNLPGLTMCSLAELRSIQQEITATFTGMEMRHVEGQSAVAARLRQVSGLIDDIFVFWGVSDSSRMSVHSKKFPVHKLPQMVSSGFRREGACTGVDPDLFYPERGASAREAKEVCKGCQVQEDCLEYALTNGEKFGVWGGMSERERRRLRRQRAAERRAAAQTES